MASNQAAYATLVADQDGVVTAVSAEVGQVVAAGQMVVRVARADEREVAIAVPENRLDEVKAASRLAVVLWANPEKVYAAKVREVAPAVDAATRTFAVRVAIAAPDDDVRWGMTANVVIEGRADTSAALVPSTAIYHAEDGKPAVWIVSKDMAVELRPVTIERYDTERAYVSEGIRTGERVVTAGVHRLAPGEKVKLAAEKPQ